MKRLVGGLVLLSLMAISLNKNAGETAITDEEVLDQLVNLRGFIDEQRDFTKASKGLKPVLVQYRSSASKIDGIVQCNLSFNTDALHLSIGGCSLQADGTTMSILIKVVYEWTEYVGYTIKSATLTCSDTKVKVDDVKDIDGEILSQLKCGDVVIKEDASGEHAYIVTFKSETGICLTYADASVIETQSYDLVGDDWVYNSEDKGTLPEFAPSGTIQDALGLDSAGKLVKGTISGGTKLYLHTLTLNNSSARLKLLTSDNRPLGLYSLWGQTGITIGDNLAYKSNVAMTLLVEYINTSGLSKGHTIYVVNDNLLNVYNLSDDTQITFTAISDSVTEL